MHKPLQILTLIPLILFSQSLARSLHSASDPRSLPSPLFNGDSNSNITVLHYHHHTNFTSSTSHLAKRSFTSPRNPCTGPLTGGHTLVSSLCQPHLSPQALSVVCGVEEDEEVDDINLLDAFENTRPSSCRADELCVDLPPDAIPRSSSLPTRFQSKAVCVAHSAYSEITPDAPDGNTAEVSLPHPPTTTLYYAHARLLGRYTPTAIEAERIEIAAFTRLDVGTAIVQRVVGRKECEGCFQVGLRMGEGKGPQGRTDLVGAKVVVGEHVMGLGGGTLVVNTFGRGVEEGE